MATAGTQLHGADPGANQVPGSPAKRLIEPPPPPEHYNPPEAPDIQEPTYEPEVTITTKGKEIHEEYRVNGRLYMIKIIPGQGKPYYLIDNMGNGQFTRSDLEPQFTIPMWVIKSF
jgi:hypothetical protein